MTKTFANRQNAVRAARQALGKDAKAGLDFFVDEMDGKFVFSVPGPVPAAPVVETAPIVDLFELPACLKREPLTGEELAAQAARFVRYRKEAAGEREIIVRKGTVMSVPKGEKRPTKIGAVLEKALTVGITTAEIHEMTGWKKIGGFFGAAKRNNLVLTRTREGKVTTYRASAAA